MTEPIDFGSRRERKLVQGQSDRITELKQRGLGWAYRIGFAVVAKQNWQYFNFDLNAGSGFNDKFGCVGSPITFLNEAKSVSCSSYFSAFVDRDRQQVAALLNRPEVKTNPRCEVFHGDNCEFPSMVPDLICHYGDRPKFAVGSVLSDPNGVEVPLEAIGQLAKICPKLDCIFHWNSTATKRGYKHIPQTRLDAVPRIIKKSHWLIRQPFGIHQFTILIGRNYRFGDWKAQGFHHLDSAMGEALMDECSYSETERNKDRQSELDL
jgi:hypothetical protein